MPKIGMEPVRRRQIIAATMRCIQREGIQGTTFARIAREAGIAPALIQHYFQDKDGLLLETFRSNYREFTNGMRRRLALAQSPAARVIAMLEAMIDPEVLTPESVSTWMVIYNSLRDYPVLCRIEQAYDRRFISTMAHALRGMGLARSDAYDIAETLAIFTDGLWQNTANPVTFTPERARDLLYRTLARLLPGHDFNTLAPPAPRLAAEDRALSPAAQTYLRDSLPVGEMGLSATSLPGLRDDYLQLARIEGKLAAKAHRVALSHQARGGLDCLLIRSKATVPPALPHRPQPEIFYLFGGGYVMGEPEADLPISAALAATVGATVTAPHYRLAPEHAFPAAHADALAAYRDFAARQTGPFAVVGESAGGGLALAMLQAARDAGLPMPRAMVLLSPWVDLSPGQIYANDGWDPTLTKRYLRDAARLYAGTAADLADPRLSPLRGNLRGLPPCMITTGSRDLLQAQAQALATALQAAGGTVHLRDWPGLWHVFEFYRALPEAAQSLAEIAAFLRPHLDEKDLVI